MRNYTRGWLKGNCPRCGKEDKFGVHIGMNRANCFYCGGYPDLKKTIMEVEGFTSNQEYYSLLAGIESTAEYKDYIPDLVYNANAELPESFSPLSMGDSQWGISARSYMEGRGFDIDDLTLAGFGYCTSGKYQGYIIMPFYMANKLVYFHARLFLGSGPRFNNPPIEEVNIGKSLVIYNFDALAIYKTVYIVESVLNARTIGDAAIAGGGKSFSNAQLSMLVKSPVENFIIILDPDAQDKAISMALFLQPYKKVKVICLPGEEDVNSYGKKKTINICRKNRYLSYTDILKLRK